MKVVAIWLVCAVLSINASPDFKNYNSISEPEEIECISHDLLSNDQPRLVPANCMAYLRRSAIPANCMAYLRRSAKESSLVEIDKGKKMIQIDNRKIPDDDGLGASPETWNMNLPPSQQARVLDAPAELSDYHGETKKIRFYILPLHNTLFCAPKIIYVAIFLLIMQ